MNDDQKLAILINKEFPVELPSTISIQELKEKLAAHIDHLINHDFEKLVFHLYRVDVDETRMRKLLEQTAGENAALLIADLIIERQLQKISTRRETKNTGDIPEDEKW